MLKKHIKNVPSIALNIIEITDQPTAIIYDDAQNSGSNLIAENGTIIIRILDDEFCFQLIRKFNSAIVSTFINISGQPTSNTHKEITLEVLKGVDYVVNLHFTKIYEKASSIIKLSNNGVVKIIRP